MHERSDVRLEQVPQYGHAQYVAFDHSGRWFPEVPIALREDSSCTRWLGTRSPWRRGRRRGIVDVDDAFIITDVVVLHSPLQRRNNRKGELYQVVTASEAL